MRPCLLCVSPYREEVVALYSRLPLPRIYEKYKGPMRYHATETAFRQLVKRHIDNKHTNTAIVLQNPNKNLSIDAFGQRMLELGMLKLEGMTAETVQLKDVIQAQKLVLDSKKLKITEDAMMLMLGKMFGPTDLMIEGEVRD